MPHGALELDFLPDGSPNLQSPHLRDVMGVMSTFTAPESLVAQPLDGVSTFAREHGTRVLWWAPAGMAERRQTIGLEKIAESIERKFAQTQPVSGAAARVIVAQFGWVGVPEFASNGQSLSDIIYRRTRSVDGVVLVGRHYERDRYRYSTYWLPGQSSPGFLDELTSSCAMLDACDEPTPNGVA
jgi:hypothetical protein